MTKFILFVLILALPVWGQDQLTPDASGVSVETEEFPAEASISSESSQNKTQETTELGREESGQGVVLNPAPEGTENSGLNLDPALASTPVLSTEVDDDEKFIARKSHWIATYGFETLKYPVFWDFSGVKKNFRKGDLEFWGGRLGFGRELYLGGGIQTATKVDGFYVGTLFSKIQNGGDLDSDVTLAYTKKTGQMYGVEASQSLSFLFDLKTKNPFLDEWAYLVVEPFIEAGVGLARAMTRLNYQHDIVTFEGYRLRVEDSLVSAKLAAGINFISNSGFFLTLKASQTRMTVSNRSTSQRLRQSGDSEYSYTSPTIKENIAPITVFALAGGYKF
jgi:hypothetical protein